MTDDEQEIVDGLTELQDWFKKRGESANAMICTRAAIHISGGGEASQEGTVMRCNGFQGRQMILQAPEGYRIVCNAEYRVVPVGEYVPQEEK